MHDDEDDKEYYEEGFLLTDAPDTAACHLPDWMEGVDVYLVRVNLENGVQIRKSKWFFKQEKCSSLRTYWLFSWVAAKWSKKRARD